MKKTELRFWFLVCEQCEENDPETPVPFPQKPEKCPHCSSADIQAYEQLTLF